MLRSLEANSFLRRKRLAGIVLQMSREVQKHYYHNCQVLVDTEPRVLRKLLSFNNIKDIAKTDVIALWKRANMPAIG